MVTNSIEAVSNIQRLDNKNINSNTRQNLKQDIQQNNFHDKNKSINSNINKKLKEKVEDTVKDMNDIVEKVREGLSFKIHDETERLMVQIINVSTREVIKELPPEEMLDLSARIQEMVGILIDEKV